MGAPTVELVIPKGKTFEFALRYAASRYIYHPIQGVLSLVPVRLQVPSHGVLDGWPIEILCVERPYELNGKYVASVSDPDVIEINDLVGECWRHKWNAGGIVRYLAPADIDGWTARAMFRRHLKDEEPLLTFTTEAGADGLFLVDAAASTFTLSLSAAVSEALPITTGVWDAEAVDPEGNVYPLVGVSPFCVEAEVTR